MNDDITTITPSDRLNYRRTMLIALYSLASTVLWSAFQEIVPNLLHDYHLSSETVGFILSLENYIGIVIQPLFGILSDFIPGEYGKRLGFILFGCFGCSALFVLIPVMTPLRGVLILIVLFTLGMSVWRVPMMAVMADLTHVDLRPEANGVINTILGVFSFWFLARGIAWTKQLGSYPAAILCSVFAMMCVAIASLLLHRTMRAGTKVLPAMKPEPVHRALAEMQASGNAHGLRGLWARVTYAFRMNPPYRRVTLIIYFSAVFMWSCAFSAISIYYTGYAVDYYILTDGSALHTWSYFSMWVFILAWPVGFISSRFGKRKVLLLGLIGLTCCSFSMEFIYQLKTLRIVLSCAGVFWSMVGINAIPVVNDFSYATWFGTFHAYYVICTLAAGAFSPFLFGWHQERSGTTRHLFFYATACFLAAAILVAVFNMRKKRIDREGL